MKSSYEINTYDDLNDAPDGTYIAHVNHDCPEIAKLAKVTNQIILRKYKGVLREPGSIYSYRGHIYRLDGPIIRQGLE